LNQPLSRAVRVGEGGAPHVKRGVTDEGLPQAPRALISHAPSARASFSREREKRYAL